MVRGVFHLRSQIVGRILGLSLLAAPFAVFAETTEPSSALESARTPGQRYGGIWARSSMPLASVWLPMDLQYDPLFQAELDFNLGLLPKKKLYIFGQNEFWAQRSAPGINNNDDEGVSTREYNVDLGFAWNPFGRLELRASAFALNNMNRGVSQLQPFGYNDGTRLEARYYFGSANIYDTGRLSFISLGYHPSKTLIAGDGTRVPSGRFSRGAMSPTTFRDCALTFSAI